LISITSLHYLHYSRYDKAKRPVFPNDIFETEELDVTDCCSSWCCQKKLLILEQEEAVLRNTDICGCNVREMRRE
jgi:hypothetical protein